MSRRLRVIGPGVLICVGWSILCVGDTPYPFGLLLGPFAMLIGISPEAPNSSECGMWIEAIILLGLMVLHPVRPNWMTGIVSGCGLFWWCFTALMYMSDGC